MPEKKFKGIPLSGGLLTNADIEEVDAQFSTDLINISLDKPGTLTIREGVGDHHAILPDIKTLYRWKDTVQTIGNEIGPVWIAIIKTDDNKRKIKISYSDYPSGWQNLLTIDSFDLEPKILDLGGSLRILLGHQNRPIFIDKIDRVFFGVDADGEPIMEWNGIYVDNLNLPHSNILTSSVTAIAGGNLNTGWTGDTLYYYYKISPVYDGYQIGSLPEQFPHKATVLYNATNKTASIVSTIVKSSWNPRITHLNLYRASSANVDSSENRTYYLIRSISTWDPSEFLDETLDYANMCRRVFSNGISTIGDEEFADGTALSTFDGDIGIAGQEIAGMFDYCFLVTGMLSVTDGTNLDVDTDFSQMNISATTMCWCVDHKHFARMQHYTVPDSEGYQTMRLNLKYPAHLQEDTIDNSEAVFGGFQHIRRINKIVDDHIEVDIPFNTSTPESDTWGGVDSTYGFNLSSWDTNSMDELTKSNLFYANYGWSAGSSPLYCNAIIRNKNLIKYGKDPCSGARLNNPVWTVYNEGDGRQGGYGGVQGENLTMGIDVGVANLAPTNGGTIETQTHSYIGVIRHHGGADEASWSPVFWSQEIGNGGLKQGQWYWITATFLYAYSSGHGSSGPNMGCYISKNVPDVEESGNPDDDYLFRMGNESIINFDNFGTQNNPWLDHDENGSMGDNFGTYYKNNKGYQMGAWYYHSLADSSDGTPYHFSIGVGLHGSSGMMWLNGGKVESDSDMFGFGNMGIFECLGPPSGTGYFGANVVSIPTAKSMESGDNVSFTSMPGDTFYIQDTVPFPVDEICKLNANVDENSAGINLLSSMVITDNGDDTITLTVKDMGGMDMERHPSHETSLNVKYKHAKMISGRLFVANVFISNSDKSEQHPNWIMFSESQKPDVIPITNYIGISDLGNGEITNLEEMGGSLVVFSANSVYRLHVPSNDPMGWSLMEAVETIGCSADDGIINIKGSLYFCARDNIYMMDANFIPQPISQYIQGTYLENYTDLVKLRHEPIKNQLYVIFSNKECYAINCNRLPKDQIWQRICFGDEFLNQDNLNDLVIDENLKSFVVFDEKISTLLGASIVEEKQKLLKATGWMKLAPQDSNIILRKLHVRYKSNVPIEFLVHIDGDSESDTLIQKDKPATYDSDATNIKATIDTGNIVEIPSNCNPDGVILVSESGVKSSLNSTTRLGIRCSSFKLILRTKNTTDPNNKTFCEIYNVEVEYE